MRGWKWAVLAAGLLTSVVLCGVALAAGWWWVTRGPAPPLAQEAIPDDPLNRVAIVEPDGNIVTVAADGGDRVPLTDDATEAHTYRYPTWSPDGRTLAFVELLLSDGTIDSALHLVAPDGSAGRRIPTAEYAPFYLFWNPTSETLAFLSNWPDQSMALRTLDVAAGATEATVLEEGQPFYFSWGPEGETMLAHIGTDRLTFLDRAGRGEPLDVAAGRFQAPHWSADGQRLAFVTEGGNDLGVLQASDARGENVTEIAREPGIFSFNWSPDNQRLAYSHTARPAGTAAFGPLWVRDVETGKAWELSQEPVIAFFWSPDGERLAFLRPEPHDPVERAPAAAPLRQAPQLWLRWHVWDGERTYPLAIFSPSRPFLADYLRFFDQYAQSISLWSPDGQTLLYAGLDETGLTGIWTLPVAEGSVPQRLASGLLATWSPR